MTTSLELQHFAVLQVSYLHKPTSIIITCTTNNPCHLTCYYTDKEPVRHATSLVKRGVALPWGAYFCFVAWDSIEQQEAGDTLIHTFEVPDWSDCQTKWFTFRGTVAGEISPSVSALLKHHHPILGPPQTEEQTAYDVEQGIGYAAYGGVAQKLTISQRIVSKLGFWLSRRGTGGTGTVSFWIMGWPAGPTLAYKEWGLASTLPSIPTYKEVTWDTPVTICEEVIILVWNSAGTRDNCAVAHYQHSDVKPAEYLIQYAAGWVEYPDYDHAYRYTFRQYD